MKIDRGNHNNDWMTVPTRSTTAQIATLKANYAKDLNIDSGITKFKNIKIEHIYRIPLGCFTDLSKINFPTKNRLQVKTSSRKRYEKIV